MIALAAAALLTLLLLQPIRLMAHEELAASRDPWLRLLLGAWSVAACWWEPWLGVIGLWFAACWTGPGDLTALEVWLAIAGTWVAGLVLMPLAADGIRWALLAVAGWQVALMTLRRGRGRTRGSLPSPALTGCYLALVAPLCPWWGWPALAWGLWLTGPSWLAVVALCAASWTWLPYPMGWVPLALCSAVLVAWLVSRRLGGRWRWLEWTPRGDSLDAVALRWRIWRAMGQGMATWAHWPFGCGPGSTGVDLKRWYTSTGVKGGELPGSALNEPLQLAYEYGVFGVAALALFAWRVGPHLGVDPWSGVVLTGAILALGHEPMRILPLGLPWLLACAEVTGR